MDDLSGETPAHVNGDIELKSVGFSYPSRPDVRLFTDFSLSIRAGQTVALVGESGSGVRPVCFPLCFCVRLYLQINVSCCGRICRSTYRVVATSSSWTSHGPLGDPSRLRFGEWIAVAFEMADSLERHTVFSLTSATPGCGIGFRKLLRQSVSFIGSTPSFLSFVLSTITL